VGTTQLNRGLLAALVAQFQGFCRGLHDQAVTWSTIAAPSVTVSKRVWALARDWGTAEWHTAEVAWAIGL
jgi:hypothetical protein